MDSQSDAALVGLSRAGNRDAFGELIRRYQGSIGGLAYLLLGDRFEAEDISQEAFLRAWLNLDLLADPVKFGSWLRRIVFGVSIDWLRAFRPELYRLSDAGAELALFAQPDCSGTALAALETIELRERVWKAVARLPAHYRLPLTLFHLDGLSHARVAQAMGVPESTVRSLVTRARQKLQPLLASYAAEVLPALQDVLQGQETGKVRMLHITDGESVAGTLRESPVPGDVRIYGDLMFEGPAPAGLDSESWRETRALFLAEDGSRTLEEARRYLGACEETLHAASEHDETVLWLDHRLSDQLILIRVLDWFGRHAGRASLSLICVGRYAGIARFVGLGQLTADQLASLADTRLRVSEAQFRLARTAWSAFTSPDPAAIERVIESDTPALPFLAAAMRRHLEQFPSADNGLSRTERQALSVLRDGGPLPALRLFFAVQRMEDPHFMGDADFYRTLARLASARSPLIQSGDGGVTLTEAGLRVLEGREDHVRLNGIDRWLGGVHLQGDDAAWRWDDARGRLVKGA